MAKKAAKKVTKKKIAKKKAANKKAPKDKIGRVKFTGNPWPKGHPVKSFEWTARFERATGIWFDLHLTTHPYAYEDKNIDLDDDEGDSDWGSKIVWTNYGGCILSSIHWGEHFGFNAGSKDAPLNFAKISKRVFEFDQKPKDLHCPRPFGVYLLGHDAVAEHRVVFKKEPGKKTYSVDWSGKLAMYYVGSTKLNREFSAKLHGVPFGGIVFPKGSTRQDMNGISHYLRDAYDYKLVKRKNDVRLLPPN